MLTKKYAFLLLFALVSTITLSQQKVIDSLKTTLQTQLSDSLKIKAYSDLCYYYGVTNVDSARHYGNLALNLSKETNNLQGEGQAYNDLGILFYRTSEFKNAIEHYKKSLNIRRQLKDTLGMGGLYNKLGIAYQRTFEMDSALYFSTKALEVYEAKNHVSYVALIKNNIANIYFNLKQYKKALDAHLSVADIRVQIKDTFGLVYSYTNIGNSYLLLKDTLQSLNYYKKGIDLAEKKAYNSELATLYNNYGAIYKDQKNYTEAEVYFDKALGLRQQLNDKYGVASVMLNLGELKLKRKKINEAGALLRQGLQLAKNTEAKEKIMNAYAFMLEYHAYKKNTDSILYYQYLWQKMQDSVLSSRITKEVAEIQEQYDTAEREKKILVQRADIAEKELTLNKKNSLIFGLGILAAILIILGYFFYNQQKLKNKQLQKESELREALAQIETQNQLQDQRLQISRDLHDNIGAQLTFIISTIDNLKYGFKITNEKLTDKLQHISAFTKETIYELRDTIWAMNKHEITFEDLQTRISNFIDKADISDLGITFKFQVAETVSKHMTLSSVEGMNVYRIIQEAINNAIKYAEASKITVDISKETNTLSIEINDNGIGFDASSVQQGNGLLNMQKRAQEINAELDVNSKKGKGTKVFLKKVIT